MVGIGKLLHLTDLLIKPIQRICKYPLILKELLRFTGPSHPDHIPLLNAIKKMEEITTQINDHRRDVENMQMLTTIQRQLDGLDIKLAEPGRCFVREGTLLKVNPRGKVQARHFILLSDMLIWAKGKNGISIKKSHLQYKGMLRLDLAVVRDTPSEKKQLHKFQIIKLDSKKIYNLVAETAELKKQWIADVDELINMWLEVEKNKQKRNTLMVQQESFLLQALGSEKSFSPLVMRRDTSCASPLATASPRTSRSDVPSVVQPVEEEPIASVLKDRVEVLEQNEDRLTKLEKAIELLLRDNTTLKKQVSDMETTISKQGKELKRMKKSISVKNK